MKENEQQRLFKPMKIPAGMSNLPPEQDYFDSFGLTY